MSLAERVKQRRIELGLTQTEAAEKLESGSNLGRVLKKERH